MKRFKRCVAALLCLCLLATALPMSALAALDVTKGNSQEENQEMLDLLESITGDERDAQAVLAGLTSMGLVDQEGQLKTAQAISLNGEEMTLAEAEEYLAGCSEEDLAQTIEVDGTELTLENLKVMLEIEQEIQRLRQTYFSDQTTELTPAQAKSLRSLTRQITQQGITLQNEAARDGSFTFPSGVDHTARVKMEVLYNGQPVETILNNDLFEAQDPKLTVQFTLDKTVPYSVTFRLRTLDGSAKAGVNYTKFDDVVKIQEGTTSCEVKIPIKEGGIRESRPGVEDTDPAQLVNVVNDNFWLGDRVFYIQATDISGALFEGDQTSKTEKIVISNPEVSLYNGSPLNFWGIPIEVSLYRMKKNEGGIFKPEQHIDKMREEQKYFLEHQVSKITYKLPSLNAYFFHDYINVNGTCTPFISTSTTQTSKVKVALSLNHILMLDGEEIGRIQLGYDPSKGSWKDGGPQEEGAFNSWNGEELVFFNGSNKDTKFEKTVEFNLAQDVQERMKEMQSIVDGKLKILNQSEVLGAVIKEGTFKPYNQTDVYINNSWSYGDWTEKPLVFIDDLPPQVADVSVTKPEGGFQTGDQVPVVVTFDGPVSVQGNETLVVNGDECLIQERATTDTGKPAKSREVTFLYTVKPGDNQNILVETISACKDISGNTSKGETLNEPVDAGITTPHRVALIGVTTDANETTKTYAPGVTEGTVTVTTHENSNVRQWLTQSDAVDSGETLPGYDGYFQSKVLGASMDGGDIIIPLYVSPDGLNLVGKFNFPVSTEKDETHVLELYELDPDTDEVLDKTKPFYNLYTDFTAQQAVFLGDGDVTITTPADWPTEGVRVYADKLTDPENFKLDFTVTKSGATWTDKTKDFAWSSSDSNVAAIDEKTGKITILTNGTVSFTLTAKNGEVPKADGGTYAHEYQTAEILVGVGNAPFLIVPESLQPTTVRGGLPATVVWSSNLTEKNRDLALERNTGMSEEAAKNVETVFTAKVYKAGEYDTTNKQPKEGATAGYTTTVKSTMAAVKSSVSIPADQIPYDHTVSVGDPSYIVEISAVSGETTYTSCAAVVVQSPPAVVKLARPDSLYITDETTSLTLNWTLENFTKTGAFRMTITNNSTGEKTEFHSIDQITAEESGVNGYTCSYGMRVATVTNDYRDTYTVEIAAQNATDSTESYDSFVLYVYDKEALQKLYVDGKETKATTLTNADKAYIQGIKKNNGAEQQEAVWNTGRDIGLTADVSADPTKPWLEVPDQFKWSAQDTDQNENGQTHATLNYQQGSLYQDITQSSRTSYGPLSEFRLSGLSDGTTTVTATHANTNTAAELAVKVETLKDKLYLFQFDPAVETTLKYTNGKGQERSVTSMADGRAAVYEESGIQGDVYLEATKDNIKYFGTIYNENLVSSEKDSTQLELYPVNYLTLRKAAQVPIFLKDETGKPYTGKINVHGGVYLNDKYASGAKLDQTNDGVTGYEVDLEDDGAHTFTFDMMQFSTDGRDVTRDPVNAQDNLQFVFQIEAEGYYPLLIRVNGNMNEEAAIATGDRVITMETATKPAEGETDPFPVAQTLYYGSNKYGYSDDVKGRRGKLGPGATYPNVELETLTLWWGMDKETDYGKLGLTLQDEYGRTPKKQTCQMVDYPFTTYPVTVHSFPMNKDTMTGWLDTLQSVGLSMVYADKEGKQIKRESTSFRVINMIGAEDITQSQKIKSMMKDTALKAQDDGSGQVSVGNAFISGGIALATTFKLGTNLDMLTMKIVPTADPTVFRGILMMGLNNMIGDNVSGIDADTTRQGDLDYMPGMEDLKKLASLGKDGYISDRQNRLETAQKMLTRGASGRNHDNDISYMLKGGFETEIYYDYDAEEWKMVVVTGQLAVGGGFGQHWNFNSFCGPVPVTAQLGYGVALDVQFQAAVDRTKMANDYLTQIQLNAFIRAFGGIGFDYAIVALKVGLFGQLGFQGAVRFLNAIEQDLKVGYDIDFDGEVGIEFLIKFLFISYERVLWSQKIDIASDQSGNWDEINAYWESVKTGKSGNQDALIQPSTPRGERITAQSEMLAADAATGMALYGSPSTATLESRDYLDAPRTYGEGFFRTLFRSDGSDQVTNLINNSYPNAEPSLSEDGHFLAFLDENESKNLEDTRASYVKYNGGTFNAKDIQQFPDPTSDAVIENADQEETTGGDSQLRLAGDKDHAVAAWTRVTQTLDKEPNSVVTPDEQMLMMNSTEVLASVWNGTEWVTTQLTKNASADMAPVVAANEETAFVAWRSVASSNSETLTTFDTNDTILYKTYNYGTDGEEGTWSEVKTLYNGTSGAVKGIEAQMTDSGVIAVAYTLEKNSTQPTTRVVAQADGTTQITSNLQTIFAMLKKDAGEEGTQSGEAAYQVVKNVQVTDDRYANENPQLTAVTFPDETSESFILGWHSVQNADGVEKDDIRLVAFQEDGTMRGDFMDSLSAINSQVGSAVTSNFRFVKNAKTLDQLSILWGEPSMTVEETVKTQEGETEVQEADSDVLKGVRFITDGSSVGLTAPMELASMAEQSNPQTIEAFDAYVGAGNTIQAVVLSTEYGVTKNGKTYHVEQVPGVDEDGNPTQEWMEVAIQNSQTNLRKLTGTYTDAIRVETPVPDYGALKVGATIPIQTTVTNLGTQVITTIDFQVGSSSSQESQEARTGLSLRPGESTTVTAFYKVTESEGQIDCPKYSVMATFNDSSVCTVDGSEINLNVPDLGISSLDLVQAQNGQRVMQISLYNNSASKLADSDRVVKVGLFSDPECTEAIDAKYVTFEKVSVRNGADAGMTISEQEDLALIDQGGYAAQVTLNLSEFADTDKDAFLKNGEIRVGGISVYLKAWVEPTMSRFRTNSGETREIAEVYNGNNTEGMTFESLITLNGGKTVFVDSDITYEGNKTIVTPTIRNNSRQTKASGYLIVDLLDENGNVLESKQTYTTNGSGEIVGLYTLDAEAERTVDPVTFNQKGAGVAYRFGEAQTTESVDLTDIQLSGIPLDMSQGKALEENGKQITLYQVTAAADLSETVLTLLLAYPAATVTVNGNPYSLNDVAGRTLSLPVGKTTLDIQVSSGSQTKDYRVEITRPSTGGPSVGDYTVTIAKSENGTVTASPSRADKGKLVTLTVKPNEGYVLDTLTVTDKSGNQIQLTQKGDHQYTFQMPASKVTVTASFAKAGEVGALPFVDVTENDWFYQAVDYVYGKGMMGGISADRFAPQTTTTRGMIVTILHRLEGSPAVAGSSVFTDVPEGRWYTEAITWAAENDIVNGVSPTEFAPDSNITREQMAAILYRYAQHKGYDVSHQADLSVYTDANQVSPWAQEAMAWANAAGLINGVGSDTLDPTGFATRAQAAAIFMRFCENTAT